MTSPPPLLRLRDLCLTIDGQAILDHVNLELGAGDLAVISGTNGSGKTTLLNALLGRAGTARYSVRGEIFWSGEPVLDLSERERARRRATLFGYVAQNPRLALLPDESVAKNLRISATLRRVPISEDRLAEVVDQYRLSDLLSQRAGSLSGGQQQLVALATAEASAPRILALDEPTAALSPDLAKLVADRLSYLTKTHRSLVCVITHGDQFAGSRQLYMHRGRLIAQPESVTPD